MISLIRYHTLAILLFIPLFFSSCSGSIDPEQEVRSFIDTMVEALEKKKLRSIRKRISNNYSDPNGYSKLEIERIVAGYILRNAAIHVNYTILDIQFNEDSTTAHLHVHGVVTQTDMDSADIGLVDGQFHDLELQLIKNGDWQIKSGKWRKSTFQEYMKGKM